MLLISQGIKITSFTPNIEKPNITSGSLFSSKNGNQVEITLPNISDTLATLSGEEELKNKNLSNTIIQDNKFTVVQKTEGSETVQKYTLTLPNTQNDEILTQEAEQNVYNKHLKNTEV